MTDGIGLPLLQSSVRAARQLAGLASRGHPLVPLLIAALLAALLALVLPLAAPNEDPDQRTTDGLADDAVRQLASEDLAAFRTSERWGVSLQEARERAAADRARREELGRAKDAEKSQAAWSPELQAIGFVGVVITASERVVLLMLPAAEIGRFHAGDVLEDACGYFRAGARAATQRRPGGDTSALSSCVRRQCGESTYRGRMRMRTQSSAKRTNRAGTEVAKRLRRTWLVVVSGIGL